MAEGHEEPYHVPQQSRRDRLRVVAAQPSFHGGAAGAYDHLHHNQNNNNHLMISAGSNSSTSTSTSPSSSSFSPPSDLMVTCPNLRNGPYGFDPQFFYGAPSQIMLTGTAWSNSSNNNYHEPLTLSLSSYNNNNNNNNINNNNNYYNDYDNVGNDGVSRSAVPLGPFVGYATVLKGSRFMRPAQQLMEELCCEVIGWDIVDSIRVSGDKISPDSSLLIMDIDTNSIVDHHQHHDHDHDGVRSKKSKLISMLDEIYRKYKQYYQQMQAVVSSFEYVSGLGNAAPYANLAVKAMSRHFGCLKSAIMDQLQFATDNNTNKLLENGNHINNGQIIRPIIRGSGLVQHQPVWRPQRGLPERAVAVLRAWLFEHFLHPYPTDTDKLMLAKQTGLSRSQVSNWFINARVRLWKPMVEEIHTLETSQSQKATSTSRAQDDAFVGPTSTSKRTRVITEPTPSSNNNNNIMMSNLGSEENNVSLTYGGLAGHLEVGAGRGGTHGGNVSLTLGLHRDNNNNNNNNNGFCLTEPTAAYTLNRFGSSLGLEGSDVMSSSFIGAPNRHFGGQLVHDFVG